MGLANKFVFANGEVMSEKASGWGGKRGEYYKGRGRQPQKYDDPVEIRICCDRS